MYREKSESISRQKLSLRNLLNMEMDEHYKSVTLNSRPNTMYTQRQLKMFSEDRAQLMTQNRMRRGASQQLPKRTRYQSSDGQDKTERHRLKHALGKINLLAEGAITVSEEERIYSIYTFLQSLSRTENFYKQAFNYIYQSFNEIVYIKGVAWNRDQLQFVASKTKCQMLIKLYNGVKDVTYKELADELYAELGKQLQEGEQFYLNSSSKQSDLQQKIQEKNQLLKKLSTQLHFYENHPSKQQYGYITDLQNKVASLQKQLKSAYTHIRELQNSQEYLNQYTNMLNERVEELRAKLYEFQIQQFSNMKEVEGNSQLKQFQQNVQVLKDLIHKGALRMASMREEYNKVQAYNQQLLGERSVLAKRAAVGFAELTPRPNYRNIFKSNEIDMDTLIPQGVKPSTEELFTSLLKCFKKVYKDYVHKQPQLELEQQSVELRPLKDPGKMILEEIDKTQRQMKKVEGLSIEVHKGYTRSKEEKEQLKNKKR